MKNFLLYLVAIVLVAIFYVPAVLFTLITRPMRKKSLSDYWRGMAESLDQTGGVIVQDLFNQWIMKAGGYPLGNIDETVSSFLGKNQRAGTLTPAGRFLAWVLHVFDKNHSIDAIEETP